MQSASLSLRCFGQYMHLGYAPKLPNVLINKPPAMEEIPTSHIVRDNFKAISAARKAFTEAENSEKIKRALRHNIRPSCQIFHR